MKTPALLLGAIAALFLQARATADPIAPAFHRIAFGRSELVVLRDAQDAVPNDGTVFGLNVAPAKIRELLVAAGLSGDAVPVSIDVLALMRQGHVLLFDTGLGPAGHGRLLASLAAAGLAPSQVSDIFITHFHGDHVGGLVTPDGQAAFPRATIHVARAEWVWAQTQQPIAGIVKAVAPKVSLFDPAARKLLVPGVTAVPLAGHTPGHVGYRIRSGSSHIVDIGDTAHSAIVSLHEPTWTIAFDIDKAKGATVRSSTLAQLATSGETVYAPHFPYPGIGRVIKDGRGFAWQPR